MAFLISPSTNFYRALITSSKLKVKMAVGSSPPKCVNKCLGCKPCMAALVISPPLKASSTSIFVRDESYYLLSWKCKCRNKYYQP
ncbi:hypothetical protein DCAR_0415946 [Daucus carota subsp. sativus]|uniref:Epidermal patterning factor-like protein n=1 Tax=Daucus carota subsp. sativus TaxID=79200 RepID=A0AAF0WZ51_DAUCS|nr:hypothetical protein DCAR_0415946 [Daucus carota subsp. sativus]